LGVIKQHAGLLLFDMLLLLLLLLQIAYTTPWIIMLSQLAYYSKIYGPQVRVDISGCRVQGMVNSRGVLVNLQACRLPWIVMLSQLAYYSL
jgi:hypothetical protein